MHPEVFTIGTFSLRWYGVFMAGAAALGFYWATKQIRRRGGGLDLEPFLDAYVWAIVAGILGARAVYVLTNWATYQDQPLSVIYIWQGGLSFHGGIGGGILFFAFWCARQRLPLVRVVDLLAPAAALGVVLGRLGNLMNGSDAAGRLTSLGIGYTWPDWAAGYQGTCSEWGKTVAECLFAGGEIVRGPVHLSQAYGAAVGLLLFLVLWQGAKTSRHEGWLTGWFILGYSLLRTFLEEPFRDNPVYLKVVENPEVGMAMLTLTQIASIPLAILGAWVLWRYRPFPASPWTGAAAAPPPEPAAPAPAET